MSAYENQLKNLSIYIGSKKSIAETYLDDLSKSGSLYVQRDKNHMIAYLLKQYKKLFIGVLAGYFPADLTDSLKNEIIRFLESPFVKEYYSYDRNEFLPEAIGAYCAAIDNNTHHYFFSNDELSYRDYFNEFLVLDYSIENDTDVQAFLKHIDDSSHLREDIIPVFMTKENMKKAWEQSEQNSVNEKEEGVVAIGAIKFVQFIRDLEDFLSGIPEEKSILRSTIWCYYEYYLVGKINLVVSYFALIIQNMNRHIEEDMEELKNKFNEILLSTKMHIEIGHVKSKIDSLLSKKYRLALEKAVKKQMDNAGMLMPVQ